VGRQGVMGIGQIGKREGHGVMSANGGRRGLTGPLIEGSFGLRHRHFVQNKTSREAWIVKLGGIELNPKHYWNELLMECFNECQVDLFERCACCGHPCNTGRR
jgi:hypothetical protein